MLESALHRNGLRVSRTETEVSLNTVEQTDRLGSTDHAGSGYLMTFSAAQSILDRFGRRRAIGSGWMSGSCITYAPARWRT